MLLDIADRVSGTASVPETGSGAVFSVGIGVLLDIADCVSGTASVPETRSGAVLVLGLVCFLISQIASPVRLAYRRRRAVRFWC